MTEDDQMDLDEEVHEAKASEAADINNSGEDAQRQYIAEFNRPEAAATNPMRKTYLVAVMIDVVAESPAQAAQVAWDSLQSIEDGISCHVGEHGLQPQWWMMKASNESDLVRLPARPTGPYRQRSGREWLDEVPTNVTMVPPSPEHVDRVLAEESAILDRHAQGQPQPDPERAGRVIADMEYHVYGVGTKPLPPKEPRS